MQWRNIRFNETLAWPIRLVSEKTHTWSVYKVRMFPIILSKESSKKNCFLGIIPKPVDPSSPIGTFRNKNLNFGQI